MTRGEFGETSLLRLAKHSAGKWERRVHEFWNLKDGYVGVLHNPFIHYPHENLENFIKSVNEYAHLHMISNEDEGKNVNLMKVVFWPVFKFFDNFVIKLGVLDGAHGFVAAVLMSFHSFIAWGELWLKKKN